MSLLSSTNSGAASVDYFIRNVGGAGLDSTAAQTPCIKGSTLGIVKIGNPVAGVSITGSTLSNTTPNNAIVGGQTAGGSLSIGNSTTSFQNIVLADGVSTVNTDLTLGNLANPASGDIIFTNGATGASISGYYSVPTAPLNCPDAADTVVPNPAGLTQGYYIIAASAAPGGQNQQQVATLAYRTAGGLWAIGGCCSSIAGAGRFGLNVSVDRTTMLLSNSTGAAQNGITVYFSKLLN
jgi:hypothetical protein